MTGLRKFLFTIGVVLLLLFTAWWIVIALGVASIIGQLLWTSLIGWYTATGLRRLYPLGGAATVLLLLVTYGIPGMIRIFRDLANDWIKMIVAVVVVGSLAIIAIPLVTVAWPLALWRFIAD